MDILQNYETAKSIFDTEFAEPVQEVLGAKAMPRMVTPQNPLINIFNPSPTNQSHISDEQINEMATLDVEYSILKITVFFGLGKGLVSGISFNNTDKKRLDYLISQNQQNTSEAKALIELRDLAELCQNQTFENESAVKSFLIVAKKSEMKRERELGTLKLHSFDYYVNKIILTQFATLFGNNPKLLSTVAMKGFQSVKSLKFG